ncbi:hypothetical protein [Streptomyces sp. NBC_00829]|uniref:hypothetical protein n=1 Tax=Streptomyces sp. NBC_00829 TaxID=2903679 RepID=UPI002F915AC0|nr:hypothetical protein OG293_40130 [Streptomyces sp. NBC_00829]
MQIGTPTPTPTPLPQGDQWWLRPLAPWEDPVLAAKVLLNEQRMGRLPAEVTAGAIAHLATVEGLSAAELVSQASDASVFDVPEGSEFFDQIVAPTVTFALVGAAGGSVAVDVKEISDAAGARQDPGIQFKNATLEVKRNLIRQTASRLGLRVTSETGGKHVKGSYHYQGRAIDVAGTPDAMARFFRAFERLATGSGVRELFYDPLGGYDNGQRVGAIGGHQHHVHIAFDPPP